MGLWWKYVEEFPEGVGVTVSGEPNLIPKDWTQRWRRQWPWVLLVINSASADPPPFRFYFECGGKRMQYRCRLTCRIVAARIGPEETRFLAIRNSDDTELPMQRLGDLFTRGAIRRQPMLGTFVFADKLCFV